MLRASPGSSSIASAAVVDVETGLGSGFGGLVNERDGALPPEGETVSGGVEFELFAGVSVTPGAGDGTGDIGFEGVTGGPQLRVVLDLIGAGVTGFVVGAFAEILDTYSWCSDGVVTNTSFDLIPELGSALLVGLGLAGLARAGRSD